MNPETTNAKNCAQCGELFTPQRSTAKFCSSACRIRAHRQGDDGNAPADIGEDTHHEASVTHEDNLRKPEIQEAPLGACASCVTLRLEVVRLQGLLTLSTSRFRTQTTFKECQRVATTAAPLWWKSLPPKQQEPLLLEVVNKMHKWSQASDVAWELTRMNHNIDWQ